MYTVGYLGGVASFIISHASNFSFSDADGSVEGTIYGDGSGRVTGGRVDIHHHDSKGHTVSQYFEHREGSSSAGIAIGKKTNDYEVKAEVGLGNNGPSAGISFSMKLD